MIHRYVLHTTSVYTGQCSVTGLLDVFATVNVERHWAQCHHVSNVPQDRDHFAGIISYYRGGQSLKHSNVQSSLAKPITVVQLCYKSAPGEAALVDEYLQQLVNGNGLASNAFSAHTP